MATGPQPPSVNEQLASLESVPLFMSSLPDDPADNPALNALQSLVHDGTPDGLCTCPFPSYRVWLLLALTHDFREYKKEVAQNFKEQGNEYFRGKRYREALGFYTQGVDAKPDDARVKEALLLNRAVCNLELRASLPCTAIPPENLFGIRKLRVGIARLRGRHHDQLSCNQSVLPRGSRVTRARTGGRGARRVRSCWRRSRGR